MRFSEWRAKRRLARRDTDLQLYAAVLAMNFGYMRFEHSVKLFEARLSREVPTYDDNTFVVSQKVMDSAKDLSELECTQLSAYVFDRVASAGARSILVDTREDGSLWFNVTFALTF